jgi:hypothetical protein
MKKFNQEMKKLKDEKKMNFYQLINDDSMKSNNYELIHNSFKNEKEISFIDSLEIKINKENNLKSYIESNFDDLQMIMIHRESRKEYYLFLFNHKSNEEFFIMKNDSIMKNKIYLLKLIQFFDKNEMMISYIKNDRKNQSKEIIKKNSEYNKKLLKYSMI